MDVSLGAGAPVSGDAALASKGAADSDANRPPLVTGLAAGALQRPKQSSG